jgi:tetratricopeptide (TPR) repeat protein
MMAEVADKLSEAEGGYLEAERICPDDFRTHKGLGGIAWVHRDWPAAEKHYRKAFELTGGLDAKLAHSVGLNSEYQGKYGEALEFFAKSKELVGNATDAASKFLIRDILFDTAEAHLRAFLGDPRAKGAKAHYESSRALFREFTQKHPKVDMWAHFNLACLDAALASSADIASSKKDRLAKSAARSLQTSLEKMAVRASGGSCHWAVRMMRQTLLETTDLLRDAAEPIRCEPLREVLESRRPDDWKAAQALAVRLPEGM